MNKKYFKSLVGLSALGVLVPLSAISLSTNTSQTTVANSENIIAANGFEKNNENFLSSKISTNSTVPIQAAVNIDDPSSIDFINTIASRALANPVAYTTPPTVDFNSLLQITDNTPFDTVNKANNFIGNKNYLLRVQSKISNFLPSSQITRDYSSPWLDKPNALPTILHSRTIQDITFSNVAVAAANKLVLAMNSDLNAGWHTIGEPMIDAVNAIRYAIMKSADGDFAARNILSYFVSETEHDRYFNLIKTSRSSTVYGQSAREDINSWLGGETRIPIIVMASSEVSGASNQNAYRAFSYPANLLSLMEPLRIDKSLLGWTQYRTNQIEFLNKWDSHNWKNSNATISNSPEKLNISLTPNLVKPSIWSPISSNDVNGIFYGSESYINYITAKDDSVSSAEPSQLGQTNFYTALASAVDALYDEADGDFSTGHRSGLFSPEWDSAGYAIAITSPGMSNIDNVFGPNADPNVNPLISLETMLFFNTQNIYDWDNNPVFRETHIGVPESEVKPYNVLNSGTILGSLIGYEPEANLDKFINIK